MSGAPPPAPLPDPVPPPPPPPAPAFPAPQTPEAEQKSPWALQSPHDCPPEPHLKSFVPARQASPLQHPAHEPPHDPDPVPSH